MARSPPVIVSGVLEGYRVTSAFVPRPQSMEGDDFLARVRERRLRQLVDEMLPTLRRLNPTMPDDQLLEMAAAMARLRLLGEQNSAPTSGEANDGERGRRA